MVSSYFQHCHPSDRLFVNAPLMMTLQIISRDTPISRDHIEGTWTADAMIKLRQISEMIGHNISIT